MREIKFRGKVRKTEFFETVNDTYPINKDYWVYGWLVKDADGKTFILPADETHVDDKDNKLYFDGEPIIPEVDPETVGQFTGMVDRNKQEIYEGDILYDHYSNNRFRVYFTRASFDVEGILEADYRHLSDVAIDSEVIGNIHDNPELLEQREPNQNGL